MAYLFYNDFKKNKNTAKVYLQIIKQQPYAGSWK